LNFTVARDDGRASGDAGILAMHISSQITVKLSLAGALSVTQPCQIANLLAHISVTVDKLSE